MTMAERRRVLIVAFDCVFAAGVVPLFALVYWKNIKPVAASL